MKPFLSPTIHVLVAAVLLVTTTLAGPVNATDADPVNGPAAAAPFGPARRTREAPVALDDTIVDIAIVGDSLLADRTAVGGAPTYVVDLLADTMSARHDSANLRIRNLSEAGLTAHFATGNFQPLRPYVEKTFTAGSDLPDLVVVAVGSTAINRRPDDEVAALAPPIIAELVAIVDHLAGLGVRTVFVPVFGVNAEIVNTIANIYRTPYRDFRPNQRIDELNRLLLASGLPFLFDHFRFLDADLDGSADRRYFVGREGTGVGAYDDGVHPNELGATVYALNLIDAMIGAFEAG